MILAGFLAYTAETLTSYGQKQGLNMTFKLCLKGTESF